MIAVSSCSERQAVETCTRATLPFCCMFNNKTIECRPYLYWAAFAFLMLPLLPFLTNDGPVHMAFVDFMANAKQNDLASRIYIENKGIHPNFLAYQILRALLITGSPEFAEGFFQMVCLIGPSVAAYFAISQVNKDRAWLAVLIFPLSLNQSFFYGLYNFCFSVIFFFLSIGSYWWMQKQNSLRSIFFPIVTLYIGFFSHAGGFIASALAFFTLALASIVFTSKQDGNAAGRSQERLRIGLILLSMLPLLIIMLLGGDKGALVFGPSLRSRITKMFTMQFIGIHSSWESYIGMLLNAVFVVGIIWIMWEIVRNRHDPHSVYRRAIGAVAVLLVLSLLALTFPDSVGGGWTHFQRMSLFPFFMAVICLSYLPLGKRASLLLETGGILYALVLLGGALYVQNEAKKELVYLKEIDRRIGQHCSVVPVVVRRFPSEMSGLRYSPFFQVASRLELSGDRVVLFSYLARLTVYPVRYQAGHDPQYLIYDWKPAQESTRVEHVHVDRFEAATGLPADYILQWGETELARPKMQASLTTLLASAKQVYQSPDGRIRLFKRMTKASTKCTSA